MTPTQALIADLASVHGCDPEDIVRAAVLDFALGKSVDAQAQVLRTVARLDAAQGDNFGHFPKSE